MNHDDGLGPYIFCKRGRSHCDDQTCECVDTAKYRAMYQMTRERLGWTLGPHPSRSVLWLVTCAAAGTAAGLVLAALCALIINWSTTR